MIARQRTASNTDQKPLYARLLLGHQFLLLPQNDIRILESVLDVSTADRPVNGVGWLRFEEGQWPVYGLDEALRPLAAIPLQQRICALLTYAQGYFGLVCSDVATVQGSQICIHSLPTAMASPNSPLCGLTLDHGRLCLVSTATALAKLLQAEAATHHIPTPGKQDHHG
jgi:hypothetical protein